LRFFAYLKFMVISMRETFFKLLHFLFNAIEDFIVDLEGA